MSQPAPTVLITGFLGVGKTTFLQDLLPLLAARGLAPFVLISDYRNAEVDASSLRALTGEVLTPEDWHDCRLLHGSNADRLPFLLVLLVAL